MKRKKAVVLVLCCAGMALPVGCGKDDDGQEGTSDLVKTMLSAIRQPDPGQFPTPQSVVEFCFEQVRNNDIDEVTKAFAIVESFSSVTMADHVRHVQILDPSYCPFPDDEFHNLYLALQPLASLSRVKMSLLGVDPHRIHTIKPDRLDEQIRELEGKLDVSRLKDLTVRSVRVMDKSRRKVTGPPSGKSDEYRNPIWQAMGVSETCIVQVVVRCGSQKVNFDAFVIKIGDNWRINDLMPGAK